jgi:hypothetical protein
MPFGYSEDGKTIYEVTWRRVHLEDAAFRTAQFGNPDGDVIMIQENERLLDPSKTWKLPPVVPDVTLDQLKAFLDTHWDPYIGGRADPGRDADDFVAELTENGLPADEYVALFNQCGLSMRDFETLLNTLRRYDTVDNTVRPFLEELRPFGVTLKQWLDAVTQAGYTPQLVLEALLSREQSLSTFLQACADRGGSLSSAIKAEIGAAAPTIRTQQVATSSTLASYSTCRENYCYEALIKVFGRSNQFPAHRSLRIYRQNATVRPSSPVRTQSRRIWVGSDTIPLSALSWYMSGTFGVDGAENIQPTYTEVFGIDDHSPFSLITGKSPESGVHLITTVNKRRLGGVPKVLADVYHYVRLDTFMRTSYRWQIKDVIDPQVGFVDLQSPPSPWIELN